jgi:putative radical SAM enzyme (TIGR03279 family)
MQSEKGVEIERILPGSQAEQLGLLPGDILLSVNSHKLRDTIDFMFYSSNDSIELGVKRNGNNFNLRAVREEGREFGVDFKPFTIKTCRNNCIFCFIKQLPKGLRKTLYMKDDDYRMSFLYGNYIALSNLSKKDRRRIIEQRLSPLYISVHSTNRTLRNKLLCNAKGPDILKELKFFADNKIRLHTQIVLCPGYNDGKELSKTIRDLYGFYPYVSSIAVVPVGLTAYRKLTIKPVEKREARDTLKVIESFQKRFKKKHGDPVVYGSDELHIKAESPLPPLKEYKDFPQIENGVGMVSQFMNRIRKLIIPKSLPRNKKFLTFTGLSFYPFLKKFIKLLEIEGIQIELIPVENRFFGSSVTVTGLLTGKDVIRTLLDKITTQEMILVPDVVLKDREDMFLDDTSLRDMGEALNISVKKIDSTPEGLVHGISGDE